METRSKRQQSSRRPPYPQLSTQQITAPSSSSASSAFQSSSSLASLQTPASATLQQSPTTMPHQRYPAASAPLPSPLAAQQSQDHYFLTASMPTSHPQQQRHLPGTQQQAFVGQRGDNGRMPETAPFLNNFNLVAEAAKRAQLACLARDFGDVEL